MIYKYLKYAVNFLTSARFKKKGKCKQCGNCCRNILFYAEDIPVTTEAQFESLKEWNKHYESFHISGKDETGRLLFTCNALGDDNRCKIYLLRGLGCRMYPRVKSKFLAGGGKLLDGCGFYYEPDRNFKSFLEKKS